VVIYKYFHFISNNPLSSPAWRDALNDAPSPVGEGWEGGKNIFSNNCLIHDCRYSYYLFEDNFIFCNIDSSESAPNVALFQRVGVRLLTFKTD
jgi:hypothetical protein